MRSDIALWASGAGGVALVGAIAYERAMDARDRTTLRLPFLILRLARFGTRYGSQRPYDEYAAELHYTLRDDDAPWIGRLANGLRYAAPLAIGGTCTAMRTAGAHLFRRRTVRLQMSASELGILAGGAFILTVMSSPLSQAEKTALLFTPPMLTVVGFAITGALRTLLPDRLRQRQRRRARARP